jgi:hypothetical protein
MHAIGAETRASGIGEKNLTITACWLAEPSFQYGDRGFGERYTTFFATLPDHANVSTCTDRDSIAFQAGHFGLAQSRLRCHQKEGVITPAKPGALIGSGEQRLDLWTGEEMHLGPREALAGDSQHALDLSSMFRHFERGISKEGVNGGQPQIPAAGTQTSLLFQVIEKRHDQWGIDRLEGQLRRRSVQPLLGKLQQQADGIAIRTDRMRTGLALLHEPLGEEPFQQWSEARSGGFHD